VRIEPGAKSTTIARNRKHPVCPRFSLRQHHKSTAPGGLVGQADPSGDMALRIERAFGLKMDTLMRMQASYNIAQTRKREKQIHVRRICQLAGIHA
jgi:hypothetical protein